MRDLSTYGKPKRRANGKRKRMVAIRLMECEVEAIERAMKRLDMHSISDTIRHLLALGMTHVEGKKNE